MVNQQGENMTISEENLNKFQAEYDIQQLWLPLQHQIWQESGLSKESVVLDVGCGGGTNSCELAKVARAVHGIELDASLIDRARQVAEYQNLNNIEFSNGCALELNVPDNHYDFIQYRGVFHHLPDPGVAMQACWRALKPGGIMHILDVHYDWASISPEPETFQRFCQIARDFRHDDGGDRYIGPKLGVFLSQNGFVNINTRVKDFNSDMIGFDNYIKAVFELRYNTCVKAGEQAFARQALDDIYALKKLPYAWAGMAFFIVNGQKPD